MRKWLYKRGKVVTAESSMGLFYDYKELINMHAYIQSVGSFILSMHTVVGQSLEWYVPLHLGGNNST